MEMIGRRYMIDFSCKPRTSHRLNEATVVLGVYSTYFIRADANQTPYVQTNVR